MIRSGFYNKIVIPLIGLFMGIVLSMVSFALLLDGILFNSNFQEKAFNNIGIYEHAAEFAGTLSPDLNTSKYEMESVANLKPFVDSAVFPELIRQNITSVTNGLISYFRGYTDQFPDLHFTADNNSIKVNLSTIFMIFGEFSITDMLLVISLLQFILKYVSIFGLILFLTMFFIMLCTDKKVFCIYMKITAVTCFILCLTAGILIRPGLNHIFPGILSQIDPFETISTDIIKGYITYFAKALSVQLILLGTAVFAVVQLSLPMFGRRCTADICTLPFMQMFVSRSTLIMLLFAILSGTAFYTQTKSAQANFIDRDLSRAVSFVNGRIQYYPITDAKNEPVYFLDVKIIDNATKLPVPNLSIYMSVKGEDGVRLYQSHTDINGISAFLLDNSHFALELDSGGILSDSNPPGLLSFKFDMSMPGRSELVIKLDKTSYGMESVKETFLQYLP